MNKINKIKYIIYAAIFAVFSYSANDTASFTYVTDGKIYLHVTPTWQSTEIIFELGIGYENTEFTQPVIDLFRQNFTEDTKYPISDLEQLANSPKLLHEFRIRFRLHKTNIDYKYEADTLTIANFMKVLDSILYFKDQPVWEDISSLTQDPDYRAIDVEYREDMASRLLGHNIHSAISGQQEPLPLNADDRARSLLQVRHGPRYTEISKQINEIFANHISSLIAQ